MAALDFPNSPTLNQQYAAPNGVTYQWDGAAWVVTGGPPGQLWTGAGATLTPTDATKTVSVPGGAASAGVATMILGSNAGKVRIQESNLIPAPSLALTTNRDAITGTQDDNTKPSWELDLSTNGDMCQVLRQVPAGGISTLLKLDNAGVCTLSGVPAPGDGFVLSSPSVTSGGKVHLGTLNTTGGFSLRTNVSLGNAMDDTSKPAWAIQCSPAVGTDSLNVFRSPAGASPAFAQLFQLDANGQLTLPTNGANNPLIFGSRTVKGRLASSTTSDVVYLTTNAMLNAASSAWVQDDAAKASWILTVNSLADNVVVNRLAPGGASTNALVIDASYNLTIAGPTAVKSTGTTWANPSDPRLKQDVASYEKGLPEICQLDPISYHLKTNPEGPLCYGFDASAVQPIFPECVTETTMKLDPADPEPTPGVLALDISPILIALVNAVKQLTAHVEALEAAAHA
jgi:Chaperone of endosialidase